MDALNFASRNGSAFSFVRGGINRAGVTLQAGWTLAPSAWGSGLNGIFTTAGKIITFHFGGAAQGIEYETPTGPQLPKPQPINPHPGVRTTILMQGVIEVLYGSY